MDDILLSPAEILDELEAASRKWEAFPEEQRRVMAWCVFRDSWLCRAQVQKLVDMAGPLIQEALSCVTPPRTLCEDAYRALIRLQQALRAAGLAPSTTEVRE